MYFLFAAAASVANETEDLIVFKIDNVNQNIKLRIEFNKIGHFGTNDSYVRDFSTKYFFRLKKTSRIKVCS